jgi:hypothetical protein
VATDEIQEEFVRARVKGQPVTLKQLAERYGRSHAGLRQAAAKGHWTEKAALAVANRDGAAARKVADQNVLTAVMLERAVEREVDVRRRHALLGRTLQGVALERLSAVPGGELPPALALAMLKLGLDEERAALGLAHIGPSVPNGSHHGQDEVRQAVKLATVVLERHAQRLGAPRSVSE